MFQQNKTTSGGLLMKKIIIASILVLALIIGSISYVASASDSIVANTQLNAERQIGVEKTVETPLVSADNILEQVYVANGFTEDDKRTNIKLNISERINKVNSTADFRSCDNINSETNKSYIYDRMLNSIDYFKSLQATYYHIPSTGYSYYSTYCIQQGENPKSKELIYNENGELISSCSFDGKYSANVNGDAENIKVNADVQKQKSKSINSIQNESIEERIIKDRIDISAKDIKSQNENSIYEKLLVDIESSKKLDFVSLVDSKKRIKYLPEENEDCYFYRNNLPQLPMSNTQYFSQAFAFGLLSDFEKWTIDRIDKTLGRECFVISGEIEGDYSEKIKTQKFEMWIDKEIGALLTLEGYDENGDLSVILTTSEFVVDESIDQSVFDDLSNL